MSIPEILRSIASTSSSKDKKAILTANKDNKTLQEVFIYTYHSDLVYGVKNAVPNEGFKPNDMKFEDVWVLFAHVLDSLAEKKLTGNAAREAVDKVLSQTNVENQKILIQILNKDLKIGLGLSDALKVWPGFVPVFDVVLAKSYKDHMDKVDFNSGEWLVQRKLDGCRIISENNNGKQSFKTRENKDFTTMGVMAERFKSIKENFVIDGELCSIDENGNEDFKSIIKIARKKDYTIANPTIKAFDFLSIEDFYSGTSKKTWTERMEDLNRFVANSGIEGILPVEYERVTSKEIFEKWRERARTEGWEGLMLRKDVPYKNGRIAELLKVKDFEDAEYLVEGIETDKLSFTEKGKGIVEHECLKSIWIKHKGFRLDVGSGFSKEERLEYFKNPSLIVGKTITVRYFEETSNDQGGISLRFPTFKGIVGDKKREV